jgi:hypothetical protein
MSNGRDAPVGVATEDHRLWFDGYDVGGLLGPEAEPEPEVERGADERPVFGRLGPEPDPDPEAESGADEGPATFGRGVVEVVMMGGGKPGSRLTVVGAEPGGGRSPVGGGLYEVRLDVD